jgi:hypothetical protein
MREDREQLLGGTIVVVVPYRPAASPPPLQDMDILHELCDYMSDETVRAFI